MKNFGKEKLKRIPFVAIAIAFIAILSVILAAVAQKQSNQAEDAIIPEVVFSGEYRIADGEWQPISDGVHISSTQGVVELKGVFKLYYDGEYLGDAERGTVISMYLDHIKATVKDSSGNVWESDNENELIGKGTCADTWSEYVYEGNAGDCVTVIIYNPHLYGNEKAIDSFLGKLSIYEEGNKGGIFSTVEPISLTIMILLTVFLLVLLVTALFATFLRQKYGREVWLLWLLVLFGEIYFIFSRDNISIWNPMYAVNTTVLGSSIMLYLITVCAIVSGFLDGVLRKTAIGVTVLIGAASISAMLSSLMPSVKFYDIYPYWTMLAVGAAVAIIVCICMNMARRELIDGKIKRKYVYIPAMAVLVAFIADAVATLFGFWQGGSLSVLLLFAIVLVSSVIIGRVVPKSIRAVIDAKSIEAEKQAMEMKLQESHISIMLSQIQPHFLYNTLNSIYYLCETNPMRARSLVNSFSEYLRNNLSSLEETRLISFETELSHVKTYLDIEKVRFEDTLEIEYDIKCVDFSLPVLTVQPIVENAVKHGTSKKRGGGKVIISTLEDKDNYVIKVSDTGCGFDPTKPKNDGKRHVGIENVKQRLLNMCDGTLTIESEVGVGTTVTVKIPKGVKNEDNSR